jgi:hypothetical protein
MFSPLPLPDCVLLIYYTKHKNAVCTGTTIVGGRKGKTPQKQARSSPNKDINTVKRAGCK